MVLCFSLVSVLVASFPPLELFCPVHTNTDIFLFCFQKKYRSHIVLVDISVHIKTPHACQASRWR